MKNNKPPARNFGKKTQHPVKAATAVRSRPKGTTAAVGGGGKGR